MGVSANIHPKYMAKGKCFKKINCIVYAICLPQVAVLFRLLPPLVWRVISFHKWYVLSSAAFVTCSSVAYSAQTLVMWSSSPSGIVLDMESVIAALRQSQEASSCSQGKNTSRISVQRTVGHHVWLAECQLLSSYHKNQCSCIQSPQVRRETRNSLAPRDIF